jgi:hypothetical protein
MTERKTSMHGRAAALICALLGSLTGVAGGVPGVESLPMNKAVIRGDVVYTVGAMHWATPGPLFGAVEQVHLSDGKGTKISIFSDVWMPTNLTRKGELRTCHGWDLTQGRFWSTSVEDYSRISDVAFQAGAAKTSVLNAYALAEGPEGRIIWPKVDEKSRRLMVDDPIAVQPLNDCSTLAWKFRCFSNGILYDLAATDDDSLIVYLPIANRMTVWYYSSAELVSDKVVGPVRTEGRPLYEGSRWRQAATFDVPFECAFRVFHHGKKVYFWCEDGRAFEVSGLDKTATEAGEQGPIERDRTARGGWGIHDDILDRFKGVNEKRVSVKQVEDLTGVTMVIRDDDRGNIYWVMPEKVVDNSTPRREVKLDKPGAVPADASGPIVEVYKLMPAIQKLHGGGK